MVTISKDDIERLQEDGAICLRQVVSPDWIARLQEAVDDMLAEKRAGGEGKFDALNGTYDRNEVVRAHVHESGVAEIAQQLFGSNQVRFFFDQVFVKEPGTDAPTPWHHDQAYWPVKGDQVLSIWLALDHVTRESSGLEYVKGSHKWNRRFKPKGFTGGANFDGAEGEDMPDLDAARDQYEFLSWELQPGDALVHLGYAIHGASGNATRDRRRRAVSTRWLGDGITYAPEQTPSKNLLDPALKSGDTLDHSSRYPLVIG